MRILFTTTGFSGHLLPLVPFARACLRAGHEVLVAAPRARCDAVERQGLRCAAVADAPAGEQQRRLAAIALLPPDLGHAEVVAKGFARAAVGAALPGVTEIVDEWRPDAIVRESYEFAGAVAGERAGVPVARVGLGLASVEEEIIALAADPVDELRAAAGLAPDPHGDALRSPPHLTVVPGGLEDPDSPQPATTLRFRHDDAGPAAPLPDWWATPSEPLVYATLGSVAGSLPLFPKVYRDVIEALSAVPARVLLTIGNDGDPAELGPLPANVHVERWVPQQDVAPHADAVVCHGGFGSVLSALRHGLPQVVVPLFAGDQWRNAARIEQVGAGLAITGAPRRTLDPPGPDALAALPGALQRVLDEPRFTQAASRIAREMEGLVPVDAAPALLAAAVQERGPSPFLHRPCALLGRARA